jgi:uncharacterized protein
MNMSSTNPKHNHHSIDYIELYVTSIASAKQFYSNAFGWHFTDYAPTYAGITIDNREVGGLCHSDTVVRGGPLVVLYSNNLEDTLTGVRNAGGTIVREIFAFPGGRRFHFLDVSGNELAVWSG